LYILESHHFENFEQQWLLLNRSYAQEVPHFRNSQDVSLHMVLSLKNFPSQKCRGEGISAKKRAFFLQFSASALEKFKWLPIGQF
jgi:hypothetical protein